MNRFCIHVLAMVTMIVLLAASNLFSIDMKSGETAPQIGVYLSKSGHACTTTAAMLYDVMQIQYTILGSDQVTFDGNLGTVHNLAAADTPWCSTDANDVWIYNTGNGLFRIDFPAAIANAAAHKQVMIHIADPNDTYFDEVSFTFQLDPPVDTVLVSGNTPFNQSTDYVLADIKKIDGDEDADGNLKLMFNGTGYAGGTTKLNVNVASQDNIDFGALQKASITAAVPTAANNADAVWDALIASHVLVGSFGLILGGTIPPPPTGSYDWLVSTEDVARTSTQTTLYYSGADNAFIRPGAVLAVKNSTGFYEKPVVASVDNGTNTITFSVGMVAPPEDAELVYLVETEKYGTWIKALFRSVLNSN